MEEQHITKEAKTPGEDRLVMLSDGIFAIATTLLVLDIKIPDNLNDPYKFYAQLAGPFLSKTIIYAVTFLVIAGYWLSHRRIMTVVRHIDGRFLWLNLLFLAFIAFFPVSSGLVGSYGGEYTPSVMIYTIVLSGCGFCALFLWLYATGKHRLVDANLDQRYINHRTVNLLIAPTYFLASLVLLFFVSSPADVFYSWFLIIIINIVIGRLYRRKLAKEKIHPSYLDD